MKLKVLVDNNTYVGLYHCGEPGASYYIEDGDEKLLLDTGYSGLFMENAKAFGIDLDKVPTIAISHGHDDHTGGLKYLFADGRKNVRVVAHPLAFKRKYETDHDIGSFLSEEEVSKNCDLVLTKEPMKLTENITYLGEIPRVTDFENKNPTGVTYLDEGIVPDYLYDDTALLYQTDKGIYVITGCSHCGICNIIEYAKKVSGDSRVLGVIGGFHLLKFNETAVKTKEYLKAQNIKELYPCHCTTFADRAEIHKEMPLKEIAVGFELEW